MNKFVLFPVLTIISLFNAGLSSMAEEEGSDPYLLCREFLENSIHNIGQGIEGADQTSLPFTLGSKGEVIVDEGALEKYVLENNENNTVSTLSWQEWPNDPFHSHKILRNDKGEVIQIDYILIPDKQTLDRHINRTVRAYVGQGAPQNAVRQKIQSGEIPVFHVEKKSLSFTFKDGQCIPLQHTDTFIYGPNLTENARRENLVTYDLSLCRSIQELKEKHPELKACSDPRINNQFATLFKEFSSINNFDNSQILQGFPPYNPNPMVPSVTRLIQQHLVDDFYQASFSMFPAEAQRVKNLTGLSEIQTANRILEDCYRRGFGALVNNDELWPSIDHQAPSTLPARDSQSEER